MKIYMYLSEANAMNYNIIREPDTANRRISHDPVRKAGDITSQLHWTEYTCTGLPFCGGQNSAAGSHQAYIKKTKFVPAKISISSITMYFDHSPDHFFLNIS